MSSPRSFRGPGARPGVIPRAIVATSTVLFAYLWFQNSWVGEDAYITGRTVWNVLHGYGLRWNVVERVQTYTHPLWMLLLVALQAVFRDFHWAAIALSLLCNGLLLVAVRRLAGMTKAGARLFGLFVLALAGSRAFFDFTSSGLENPLTSLLLVAFVLVGQKPASPHRSTLLVLVASLVFLNRMDAILLLAPAIAGLLLVEAREAVAHCEPNRWVRTILRWVGRLALAAAPAWLWLAFSVFYYGFPFPNTAYAKLSTGVGRMALDTQGLAYVRHTVNHDPLTPFVILFATVLVPWLAAKRKAWLPALLALGLPVQCAYVVSVGGDFMGGRFFSPAFSLALALLLLEARESCAGADTSRVRVALGVAAAILIAEAALLPHGPIRTFVSYRNFETDDYGIADEKGYYHNRSSLGVRLFRQTDFFPSHRFVAEGLKFRAQSAPVTVECNVGYFGYYAGPSKLVIDECGLTDPFLSRLPADPLSRIGHFIRPVPLGYPDAVLSGDASRLADPALRQPYAELVEITRGPLLSLSRLRRIARWNLDHPLTATLAVTSARDPAAKGVVTPP